jgi:hypothetical protein
MTNQGRAIIGVLLLFAPVIRGQQTTTTNTNCNVYGNNANCTSTSSTTDNAAQQQQAYEAGQKVGDAIGGGIALAMQSHSKNSWVKKFCAGHPGESWRWTRNSDGTLLDSGRCLTDEDKGVIAANEFMAHHKDFIKGQPNSEALVAYLDTHNLDPRLEKSYERAYKDLKKAGQLQLYSR